MTSTHNSAKTEAFSQKILDSLNAAALTLMASIGHRTGLFDTMSQMPPAGTKEIAERSGLNERYVREWLGAMVTGGIIEHDSEKSTFWLPQEHAACLTRESSPNNLAVSAQWIAVLGSVEDNVVEAFEHGRGVPYSAYNRFHSVMAEESGQTVIAGLMDHILPLADGLNQKLSMGIDVLDIGCGSGLAMNFLASQFPNSRFRGYDFSEEGIYRASEEARHHGRPNAHFEVKDVAELDEADRYDLITAFDAIHDQATPDKVLWNIRSALKPDGLFLMQDIAASTHVHHNVSNPFGPFIYTISCMHCMSVSLASGGPGLGAAWGKEQALKMLKEAGFTQVKVEELPHDPQNYYYLSRKG